MKLRYSLLMLVAGAVIGNAVIPQQFGTQRPEIDSENRYVLRNKTVFGVESVSVYNLDTGSYHAPNVLIESIRDFFSGNQVQEQTAQTPEYQNGFYTGSSSAFEQQEDFSRQQHNYNTRTGNIPESRLSGPK